MNLTTTTTTTKITYDDAVDLLFKAVADRGFQYQAPKHPTPNGPSCAYVDPGSREPSCIVGWVLNEAGFPMSTFTGSVNTRNISAIFRGGVLPPRVVLDVDPYAQALLDEVQRGQDNGSVWGEAVIQAITKVSERRRAAAVVQEQQAHLKVDPFVFAKDAINDFAINSFAQGGGVIGAF